MSARRPVVAIFVKTPGRSPVKTRLARDIGQSRAESIYRESLACVVEAVESAGLERYWAVAEPEVCDRPPWDDAPCIAQPEGDLGARMAGVFRGLRNKHASVLLVGADLPQLDPDHLEQAARWLDAPDRHVLGSAADGGFWLYGSSAEDPTSKWSGLPYSRPETAKRFRQAVDAPASAWQDLPQRADLDEIADVPPVLIQLESLRRPTPAQQAMPQRLREWLAADKS